MTPPKFAHFLRLCSYFDFSLVSHLLSRLCELTFSMITLFEHSEAHPIKVIFLFKKIDPTKYVCCGTFENLTSEIIRFIRFDNHMDSP